DLNIAVSPEDKALFERLSPGVRCEVIPNGVDTDEFRPAEVPEAGCVFVGGTSWFPNKDALSWYSKEILPLLDELPEQPLTNWVGRASDEEIRAHSGSSLALTGYVPDIRPYVHQAAVFVAPLRVGGGTRLKILDAWAMGKAVVSTRVGCEGLAVNDGENILIADDSAAFAAAVSRLLRHEDLRRRIGLAARRLVEERYSWKFLGGKIYNLYNSVIRDSAQKVGTAG
ncbi:MAG: glycosyltransferase family 4 protein, partial [Gemmatimonadales bacterium]